MAIRCCRPLQYDVPIAGEPLRQLRPLRARLAAFSVRRWLRPSLVAFPVVAAASRQTRLSVIELNEALVLPSSTVMAPPHETPDQLAGDRSARDANSPEMPKLRTSGPGATLIVDTSSNRHLQISGSWSGPSPSGGRRPLAVRGAQYSGSSHGWCQLRITCAICNLSCLLSLMPALEIKSGTAVD